MKKVLSSKVGQCKLYWQILTNGLTEWSMYSPFTGNHSIITDGYDERVVNHWNGFVDNQPDENYSY